MSTNSHIFFSLILNIISQKVKINYETHITQQLILLFSTIINNFNGIIPINRHPSPILFRKGCYS